MDILAGLNTQQRLAVEHGCGPALVLAGAGSGKTRVIVHRIAYLINNGAARPQNILAVTFTNKAAGEMRERVQTILGASRSAEPLISTFHSFCVRLLRREIHHLGYRRDFSIYDTDDQRRLVKKILEELKIPEKELSPREVLSRISYAKNHGISPDNFAARFPSAQADNVENIYRKYNASLRNANSLDFDDLLLKAAEVLRKAPDLKKYYSNGYGYILVDEYQDTNHPQYELLKLLTAVHDNIFVVGDEDQSIYKFRGADIRNILAFEQDFPGTRVIKLEQNYRSTGTILKVAGAVVKNNIERKGKTLWTDNDAGDAVCCRSAESPREEARLIAGHIKKLLKENPEWRVAILYRANFLSRNFEDVLTEEGIPYAVVGSVAFFGRMEVKDLLAHLRIIFNPEDDIALLRIFNTPPKGIGSATIDFLTEAAINKGIPILRALRELIGDGQVPNRAVGALTRFLELVDRWTAVRETLTTAKLLETILGDIRYREMLEKRETAAEAENRMANIQELIQAAAESEQRGETVGDFLDRASLSSDLDQLNPDARVALMTLHSAKGLEFDAVFMAGMEEGLFPHVQSTASDADLEEERRLCYVGITRARQKLFLTWTPFRKNYGPQAYSPAHISRFLEEMPPDLVEGMEAGLESAAEVTDRWNRISNRFGETSGSCRQGFPKKQVRDFEMPADQPKSIAEIKAYLQQHHQKSAATAGMESKSAPVLKAGARVRHDQFGEGIILSRERMGNEIKLVITFSRVGKKSLVEKYAKLKAI